MSFCQSIIRATSWIILCIYVTWDIIFKMRYLYIFYLFGLNDSLDLVYESDANCSYFYLQSSFGSSIIVSMDISLGIYLGRWYSHGCLMRFMPWNHLKKLLICWLRRRIGPRSITLRHWRITRFALMLLNKEIVIILTLIEWRSEPTRDYRKRSHNCLHIDLGIPFSFTNAFCF